MQQPGAEPQTFVFLLVPGLSLMSLSSALEPLRSLNRLVGREAYRWRLASLDGAPVAASNGIDLPATRVEDLLRSPTTCSPAAACGSARPT